MAKPTYIILKDQPQPDSYGQYFYSAENMLANTGLETMDTSDDLYSIRGPEKNIGENLKNNIRMRVPLYLCVAPQMSAPRTLRIWLKIWIKL